MHPSCIFHIYRKMHDGCMVLHACVAVSFPKKHRCIHITLTRTYHSMHAYVAVSSENKNMSLFPPKTQIISAFPLCTNHSSVTHIMLHACVAIFLIFPKNLLRILLIHGNYVDTFSFHMRICILRTYVYVYLHTLLYMYAELCTYMYTHIYTCIYTFTCSLRIHINTYLYIDSYIYMHIHVYMNICSYTCFIYTKVYAFMHIYMCTCVHMYTYIYLFVVRIYICLNIFTYIYVYIFSYIYMYTRIHVNVCMYVHIYTNMQSLSHIHINMYACTLNF